MEILWILANVILGVMLWDIHRGTREIIHIAQEIHESTQDIHRKTDAILGRLP